MKTCAYLLAGAVSLASIVPALAAPSAAEKKMVAVVEAEQTRQVALFEKVVSTNSGSMNFAGVRAVGQMMEDELRPLGFETRWIDLNGIDRAGHVVATHKGDGRGKRMLLIGHIDTVFEPASPFQTWTRKGDTVEGPGVADMKGGLIVMIGALRAMQAAGTLKNADITVFLTGDEEKPGAPISTSRGDLIAAARASDVALDFETLSRAGGRDVGSIARRSADMWRVEVTAKSGHSSMVCRESAGCGATYELARILDAFRKDLAEPNLTYNVGAMAGGSDAALNETLTGAESQGKANIISAKAVAYGDLRALTNEQIARTKAKMQAIVDQPLPHTKSVLTFEEAGYPAMAPTEGNRALLAKLNQVNRDIGAPEMPEGDPAGRGAGDIAFVSFIDGLVGLGVGGEGSHAPGETADLKSLETQTKRAAVLMTRLSKEPRVQR